MKIWMPLIVTGTGSEVYTRRLAAGLTARGHDVRLDEAVHKFQYAPWVSGLKAPAGTDVILANSWNAAAFAGPAPLVSVEHLVVHDPAFRKHKSFAQSVFHRMFVYPMEVRALRRSAAVIAVSQNAAEATRTYITDVPVDVILNAVDTDIFCPAPVPPPPRENGAPLELLFVGKPSLRKGFDLVAELVTRLGDACRFTCVGDFPAPKLPKPPGHFTGRVPREETVKAYRNADLLLFPSRLEGSPYVVAEAMACGLPVVCVPGGAVAEMVPTPDCGIACPADAPHQFVSELLRLKDDRPRLAAMSDAARQYALAHFTESRWLDQTEAVLKRAASSTAGPKLVP